MLHHYFPSCKADATAPKKRTSQNLAHDRRIAKIAKVETKFFSSALTYKCFIFPQFGDSVSVYASDTHEVAISIAVIF